MAVTGKAQAFYRYLTTEVVPKRGWPKTSHELLGINEDFRALSHHQTRLTWQRLFSALMNDLGVVKCTQGGVLFWAEEQLAKERLSSPSVNHRDYGMQPFTPGSVLQGARWEGRLGPSVKTFECGLCHVRCGSSEKNYKQHLDGKPHRNKMAAAQRERLGVLIETPPGVVDSTKNFGNLVVSMPPPQERFRRKCAPCNLTFWTAGAWNTHLSLPPHTAHIGVGAAGTTGVDVAEIVGKSSVRVYFCRDCQEQLTEEDAPMHKYGTKHKAALAAKALQSGLANGVDHPARQTPPEANAPFRAAPSAVPRSGISQRLGHAARPVGLSNQGVGLALNQQPLHASAPSPAAQRAAVRLDIVPGDREDYKLCTLCGREVHKKAMFNHVKGRKHREILHRREQWLADWGDGRTVAPCHVCQRELCTVGGLRMHQKSEVHQEAYQMLQSTNVDAPAGGKRLQIEPSASTGAPPGAKRRRSESPTNGVAPAGKRALHVGGPTNAAAPAISKRKHKEEESAATEADVKMSSEELLRKKRRMERFGDGAVTGASRRLSTPAVAQSDVQVSRPAEGVPQETGKQAKKFTPIQWTLAPTSEQQVSDRAKLGGATSGGRGTREPERSGRLERPVDGMEKRVSGSRKTSLGDAPSLKGAIEGDQGAGDLRSRAAQRERVDGTASNRSTSTRDLRGRLTPSLENRLSKPGAGLSAGVRSRLGTASKEASNNDVRDSRAGAQSRTAVTVSRPFPAGNNHRSAAPETELSDVITVHNGGSAAVSLLGCRITPPSGVFSLVGVSSPGGNSTRAEFPITISGRGASLSLTLVCKTPPEVGVVSARLELEFEGFGVSRDLRAVVEDAETQALRPREEYRPERVTPRQSALPVVTDPLPPLACLVRHGRELLGPCVDRKGVERTISGGEELAELAAPLDVKNYAVKGTVLYHLEAMQQDVDIRGYDIPSAKLTSSRGEFLELEVPGLAERRPSVALGDPVYLTPTTSLAEASARQPSRGGGPCEFEAFVHAVKPDSERIYIKSPRLDDRTKYRVRFRPNLETLTHAQHALRLISEDPFFPPLAPLVLPFELPSVLEETEPPDFDRKDVQLNDEQAEAVSQILLRTRLRGELELEEPLPPYVVFGPPGTGKTKTLVEAVFQVLKADPNASILACAPSNGAADNLLERLKELSPSDLIRVNAFHRLKEGPGALPAHLEKFARYDSRETHSYTVPPLPQLQNAHVIVTTCSSSALLWRAGIDRRKFSHIFIDEAGHATEPETFIPLGCFAAPDTVIVLAGDHQQLGPTVRSPLARENGFVVSYLERLYRLPFYDPEAGDNFVGFRAPVITKLLRNYRSHPLILQLPWKMFYQDDLLANADKTQRESLCQLAHLPTPGVPIIFEGVEGLDERGETSPSLYNEIELRKILAHVKKLRDIGSPRIEMKTVGVITPYRRQCEMAKKRLEAQGLGAVKVGTVEEFQGQEMRAIIISAVRSSPEHVEFDKQHGLGFLGQPKRFNVAVTRAKELLIIIGNPRVLGQDECWGELLRFCVGKGAYIGCKLPSAEDAPEAASLGEYVSLGDEDGTEDVTEETAADGDGNEDGEEGLLSRTRPSHVALYEEPAWPGPE